MPLILTRFIILALLVSYASACQADCDETFKLDSVTYPIPDRWCGQKIDSLLIADPKTLVRLSSEFCWQDYRIYLTKSARDALTEMADAAKKDNVSLLVQSSYRSARYQRTIIKRRLDEGQELSTVLQFVAPPGYSEHETGRAVDFKSPDGPFEKSNVYAWLKSNGTKFGFIESLPEENTGSIPWEPWHWFFNRPLEQQ